MKKSLLAVSLVLAAVACKNSDNNNAGTNLGGTQFAPGAFPDCTTNPQLCPTAQTTQSFQDYLVISNSGVFRQLIKERGRFCDIGWSFGSYSCAQYSTSGAAILRANPTTTPGAYQTAYLTLYAGQANVPISIAGFIHTANGGTNLEFVGGAVTALISSATLTSPLVTTFKYNGQPFATANLGVSTYPY